MKSFESAIQTLNVISVNNKTALTFILLDSDFKIITDKPIQKTKAKAQIKELGFYKILKE